MAEGILHPTVTINYEPANTTALRRHLMVKKWILLLECPPCYPDWDPCDFLLFPPTKHLLKETHFRSLEQVQQHTSHTTSDIRRSPNVAEKNRFMHGQL
jgi:hypothetical protein